MPTPEQLAKLPKWAQEHIEDITRQHKVAVGQLNQCLDTQTPSSFFIDEYVGIGAGSPKNIRKYVQTHKISIQRDGVRLDVLLRIDEPGIEIAWIDDKRMCSEVAMVPTSFQKMKLIPKDKMR